MFAIPFSIFVANNIANFAEVASDLEESISHSPQSSPVIVKKRGHWGKVLMKAKREQKNPPGFQSLASVSLMMLPTITVAGSTNSMVSQINLTILRINTAKSNGESEFSTLKIDVLYRNCFTVRLSRLLNHMMNCSFWNS